MTAAAPSARDFAVAVVAAARGLDVDPLSIATRDATRLATVAMFGVKAVFTDVALARIARCLGREDLVRTGSAYTSRKLDWWKPELVDAVALAVQRGRA